MRVQHTAPGAAARRQARAPHLQGERGGAEGGQSQGQEKVGLGRVRRDQLERAVGGMSGGSFQFPASSLVFCAVVYCCSMKEPDFERLSRLVLDEFKRVTRPARHRR